MSPSTDEDETASSDREDEDDEDDGDDSDPTAHRERIRRNHVWAIISLLEEQAKGSYHLMVPSILPIPSRPPTLLVRLLSHWLNAVCDGDTGGVVFFIVNLFG